VVLNRITMANGSKTIVTAPYKQTEITFQVTFYTDSNYALLRSALSGTLQVAYYSARTGGMLYGLFYADLDEYDVNNLTGTAARMGMVSVTLTKTGDWDGTS